MMSKKYPECPLYDHLNCKELDKPDVCALVREDKKCLKKEKKIWFKEISDVSLYYQKDKSVRQMASDKP